MKRLLTSCFGLGFLPIAPGTWGSLPVLLVFYFLSYFNADKFIIAAAMAAFAVLGSFVCVKFAPAAIEKTGSNDPREVVADEVAGQAVTFLGISLAVNFPVCVTAAAGFLLFRLFDIFKPWPIKKLEHFPKGWGILLDDIAAGIYSAVILTILYTTGILDGISKIFEGGQTNSLTPYHAAFLGFLQGITEFLPISSSGHLVLFEHIFKYDSESPQMLVFDLLIHAGTMVSIFIVFRKSILRFLKNLYESRKFGLSPVVLYQKSPAFKILVLAFVCTAITAVIGMTLKDYFKATRGMLWLVGICWIINGTILLITDFRSKTKHGLKKFGFAGAIIVALFQSLAILPGISRSGSTISGAILYGLKRRWAVEFSFLIAIPTILGATLVETMHNLNIISFGSLPLNVVIIGPAVAAISGIAALTLLLKTARKAKLRYFAIYSYLLAIVVLIYTLQ